MCDTWAQTWEHRGLSSLSIRVAPPVSTLLQLRDGMLMQITGQHYVLIRSPHRTNKYCPYTIHNTVTVRIRNLEYLDTYITINNLETCFFSITWNIYTPYSCMLYVKMMFGQLANKKSFKTIDDKLVSEHTLRIFFVFHLVSLHS